MTDIEESCAERAQAEPAVRAPRASVFLTATLAHFDRSETTAHRVRDLSSGGMRIDQAHLLRQGASVFVTVGALKALEASVVWIDENWAGLALAQQINPDEARARTASAPAAGGDQCQLPAAALVKVGWLADLQNAYRR
jgi:hypothetical protein